MEEKINLQLWFSLASVCFLGLNRYLAAMEKPKKQNLKQLSFELDAFKQSALEISVERNQLIKGIIAYKNTSASVNQCRFFAENTQASLEYLRKQAEEEELLLELVQLVSNYPPYNADLMNDSNSIEKFRQELIEYHVKVQLIAGEFFKRTEMGGGPAQDVLIQNKFSKN